MRFLLVVSIETLFFLKTLIVLVLFVGLTCNVNASDPIIVDPPIIDPALIAEFDLDASKSVLLARRFGTDYFFPNKDKAKQMAT